MHAGPAVSAFQKKIRGDETVLRDHICKQMNELNLERCRCIPKEVPGADWRCLEQLVARDPARELYKVHCHCSRNVNGRKCLQQLYTFYLARTLSAGHSVYVALAAHGAWWAVHMTGVSLA